MPLYDYRCTSCNATDERYIRLVDYDKEANSQRCECGAKMKKLVSVPVLAGMDSGPGGFLRGRTENDGCPDEFTRQRVKRNNGGSMGGGFWVPGLCRQGKQFDNFAVCHSRDEVIHKAKQLGVAVRGPGINVDPRQDESAIKASEHDDGVPSERAVRYSVRDEVQKKHGGKVTRRKYKEIVERVRHESARSTPPVSTPTIDSIFPPNM